MRLRWIHFVLALALGSTDTAAADSAVYVNGVRLSDEVVAVLENGYGTTIADGRYWYDPYSGLWGREGGPTLGRIDARSCTTQTRSGHDPLRTRRRSHGRQRGSSQPPGDVR